MQCGGMLLLTMVENKTSVRQKEKNLRESESHGSWGLWIAYEDEEGRGCIEAKRVCREIQQKQNGVLCELGWGQ